MAYEHKLSDYLRIKTTASQRRMVDLIEQEFTAAGYDRPVIVAAVANSYIESDGWNPLAHTWGPKYKKTGKKTEDSAGLFQLNRMGGHGEGMPVGNQYPIGPSSKKGDSRYDPSLNSKRILEVMRGSTKFSIAQYTFGHDAERMAEEFCKIIELPDDADVKGAERRAVVRKLFPEGWDGPLESPRDELAVQSADEPSKSKSIILWLIGGSILGLLSTAALREYHIRTGRFVPPSRRK
jgi:hypothetical protein